MCTAVSQVLFQLSRIFYDTIVRKILNLSFTLDLNDREEQGQGRQCKIVQQLIAHGDSTGLQN